MRFIRLLCLVLGCTLSSRASADSITLPCVRDNTLFEDAEGDTSNGAGPALFAGRNSQGRTRRALLAFGVAGSLPTSARIDNVVLQLEISSAPDTAARDFSLHRVLRTWGEGASSSSGGGGALAMAGDATWLHAIYPAAFWHLPGGDFEPAASAQQHCGDIGPVEWNGPGLVADVRAWLDDPAANHGWILLGEETGIRTVRRFDSRESGLPSGGPALTIQFTRQDPVAAARASWGRLKASYR